MAQLSPVRAVPLSLLNVQFEGTQGRYQGAPARDEGRPLEERVFIGVVADYAKSGSQAKFTLKLPSNGAFALLTGTSAVTVYQQASTETMGAIRFGNGRKVEVRGLLFFNGRTYKLFASRIGKA